MGAVLGVGTQVKLRKQKIMFLSGQSLSRNIIFWIFQLACECTRTACCLCCSAILSCKNATSTRLMYTLMLMIGSIVSAIALAPGLQEWLQGVPFCKNSTTNSNLIIPDSYSVDCTAAVG